MTKREWLERQGPWNLSAETIFSEFHALLECARQLADDADEERRRLKKVREAGRNLLKEFGRAD